MRSVATPEPITPSRRLRSAAVAERERLGRDLERADKRIAALRQELVHAEQSAREIRRHLALLAELAHDRDEDSAFPVPGQLQSVNGDAARRTDSVASPLGYLRGADIRRVAVRILASTPDPSRPIHYTEWYRLVDDAGYGIAGRDPLATFLTQIGRSPIVSRAGERGIYALDLDAPRRLRERLHSLHQELIALHDGQQTFDQIATVRERRAELTSECAHIERALEEATGALGMEAVDGLASR